MDGDDGVVPVVFPAEHTLELNGLGIPLRLGKAGVYFPQGLFVALFLGELKIPLRLLDLGLQLLPENYIVLKGGSLFQDLLGGFVVVPEIRL
jgi:hypothetical protein